MTIKVDADVSSWSDNVQGDITTSFKITNTVPKSNSALVSKVELLNPVANWIQVGLPSSSRVEYGSPVTVDVKISKSVEENGT